MNGEDEASDVVQVLPEQRVGTAMREARELSSISLRQMAKRLGYNSHTALSSYERGAVMPTEKVIAGYEQVLGLRSGELTDVLEAARVERHGDAWAKRRVHLPTEFIRGEATEPATEHVQRFAATEHVQRFGWLRSRSAMVAGAVVLVLLVALGVGLALRHPRPAHHPLATVSVADGSDPEVTCCAMGAVNVDSVGVYDPPEHLVGRFQLRSSARCGANWGRFVPTSPLLAKSPLTLQINVYRPADGAVSKYRVTYDNQKAYGNMLVSRYECVYATVTLIRRGQVSPATVQTNCARAPRD
jgi:transcriptional regulator with XRE-family HTH domain